MYLIKGFKDSSNYCSAVMLWHSPNPLFQFLEIALATVLQHDVPGAIEAKIVDQLDDILVVEGLHELDFFLCHLLVLH